MKTIILTILALALFIPMAYGADVVITITIPDAYVSRLQAAVANLNCDVVDEAGEIIDTLNPKACLTRKIVNDLKVFVKMTEELAAKIAARDAYDSYLEQWAESYDELDVN